MTLRDDIKLRLVETWEDAQAYARWLGGRRPILACDTETEGLNWWDQRIRLVQFGDLREGWSIPWERWGGLVDHTFNEYESPVVFHNSKFDVHFLERAGVNVDRALVHDTMLMAHIIDPLKRIGLKDCSKRYVDPRAGGGDQILKDAMKTSGWGWHNIPIDFEAFWTYAAMDTVITAYLYEELRRLVTPQFQEVYELEMDVNWVLLDMEDRGIRVDTAYCARKKEELLSYYESGMDYIRDEYGLESLSSAKLADVFEAEGVKLTEKTPTGKWKMDKEILESIDHPLAELVTDMKQARKWSASYFGNILENLDNDRVHPSVKAVGAKTGRMSVTTPALQTMPRGPLVRDTFIPSEGNLIVAADYSQIEARLMAHYSDDPGFIRAFEADDFFTEIGKELFQDPKFHKEDPRRTTVKNTVYSRMYGAGPNKFAQTAGIPVAEAQMMYDRLATQFPGIESFADAVMRAANERYEDEGMAYAYTLSGRRQQTNRNSTYKLVNALIQGSAADLFKQSLLDLDAVGVGKFLVLVVHDEVVLDVPKDLVEEVEQLCVDAMERIDFAVPITVEANHAETYGKAK